MLPLLTKVSSCIAILLLTACSVTPSTIVQQPTTARPAPVPNQQAETGAIYNSASYHALFEDRRPSRVGDIVTINIVENTSAKKAGNSAASKDGSHESSISSFFGDALPNASFGASSSTEYSDSKSADSSNTFSGSVTATVVEVLANGNLVISGEKQVALDKGTEFIRLSGVINPDYISADNAISSSKVADARIEYRTNTNIDASEIASMFARFFLSMAGL